MRTSYSTEFKLTAAALVLDQQQSAPDVCQNMNIGPTALRRWVEQLRKEREGTSCLALVVLPALPLVQGVTFNLRFRTNYGCIFSMFFLSVHS
jgi:transposase